MINFSTVILSSEINGPGGLFDLNATLPLVAIQFLILMFLLNSILFNPVIDVINERDDYILNSLEEAGRLINESEILNNQYQQKLTSIRKETQLEITNSQKINKEILNSEIEISQTYIDNFLDTISNNFEEIKTSTLNNLENSVKSLCDNINTKLSI